MNTNLKSGFSVILFSCYSFQCTQSQPVQESDHTLQLKDTGRKIENSVSFTTSKSNYEKIRAVTGKKILVITGFLIINGDTIEPVEIMTRGQSTLLYPKKSFSFNLRNDAEFGHNEKKGSFKKFYMLSLSMDRNYFCNRLAYEMMEELDLFDLFYSYCDLRINGKSEGIYLVIERPEDWALKKMDSPVIIGRGYNHDIDKLKAGENTSKEDVRKYRNNYTQIYRSIDKYEGEEFFGIISVWLETENYLEWLAFNFFVRNGDYTDEVYFFVNNQTGKFGLIPWDYDDLFSLTPHEGNTESRKEIAGKLFFSTEDELDKKIVNDPWLYNKYLIQLGDVLNRLTVEKLKRIFEETYTELFPYYSDEDIISRSKYDRYGTTDLNRLQKDLDSYYNQLLNLRQAYTDFLKKK
jgi:spore coat protein H